VYLIGSPTFGWYKIGKSRTPEVRVQNIGVLLPFKVEVIGVWKSVRYSWLETHLHERHAKDRINGEWFKFNNNQVKEIESYLTMYLSASARVRCVDGFTNIEQDDLSGIKRRKLGTWTKEQYEARKALRKKHQKPSSQTQQASPQP
jgi:hypothetical protein